MNNNFEMLYEEEKRNRIALELEFAEYRESSSEIEDLLEKQIGEMTQLVSSKERELKEIKEKALQSKSDSEKALRSLEREFETLRQKYDDLVQTNKKDRVKLVQQENETEYLESQNRMLEAVNQDLEQKIDSILEELALLQTELEENNSNHNRDIENIERLKQQIRDTESELFAQQMKGRAILESSENSSNIKNNHPQQQHLQNYHIDELSNASTASTVSTLQGNTRNIKDAENCEDIIDPQSVYKRSVKKSRTGGQNLTYSFNSQQITDFQKLYVEDQKETIRKELAILQQSPQISEKNSSTSNNSSGKKEELDTIQQLCEGTQRGRKLTSFCGKNTERYSEARRRLQEKIIKEKISIYDTNINNLRLTKLGFNKSLNLVSNLIKDLGDKMGNIRNKKALFATPRKVLSIKKI